MDWNEYQRDWLIFLIGLILMASPVLAVDKDMALIGANSPNPVYMDRFEVTKKDYKDFLIKGRYPMLKKWPSLKAKHPNEAMDRVTWFDAASYCQHLGKRLPTKAEWLVAIGFSKQDYPWGNKPPDETRGNFCDINCKTPWAMEDEDDHFERIAPVGSFPKGQSPQGLFDLAGNLWEWTSTDSNGKTMLYQGNRHSYGDMNRFMLVFGGSYGSRAEQLKNGVHAEAKAAARSSHVGFRCVKAWKKTNSKNP